MASSLIHPLDTRFAFKPRKPLVADIKRIWAATTLPGAHDAVVRVSGTSRDRTFLDMEELNEALATARGRWAYRYSPR